MSTDLLYSKATFRRVIRVIDPRDVRYKARSFYKWVKEESTSTSCLRNLNLKVLLAGNFKKRKSAQELCGGYVILAEIKTVCVCVCVRERESK